MNLKRLDILLFVALSFAWAQTTAQSVPSLTGSKISQSDAQAALDFHNKVRKEVGSPSLEWSAELSAYAQAWAEHLAKDNRCKMQHRPHEGKWKQIHGENIFWGSNSNFNATNASQTWYDEIKDYKYAPLAMSVIPAVGHYTQMVWKNTMKVGMGQASCPDGAIIIVGNYDPAGNYLGQKPY